MAVSSSSVCAQPPLSPLQTIQLMPPLITALPKCQANSFLLKKCATSLVRHLKKCATSLSLPLSLSLSCVLSLSLLCALSFSPVCLYILRFLGVACSHQPWEGAAFCLFFVVSGKCSPPLLPGLKYQNIGKNYILGEFILTSKAN